jgi:DNA end-binding protein Ku
MEALRASVERSRAARAGGKSDAAPKSTEKKSASKAAPKTAAKPAKKKAAKAS